MSTLAAILALLLAVSQSPPPQPGEHVCSVDLARVGQMEDILSNALIRGLRFDEPRVRGYLEEARKDCADGPELLRKTAAEFELEEGRLRAEVERYRHVNCTVPVDTAPPTLSRFAADVALHVVLHELGHALVREFDLPVLGNEETMADAFATHYLVTELPERAPDVLLARVASLSYEADEIPRAEWPVHGEHGSDARRAYQIAALAVAADRTRYAAVARRVGMSDDDVRKSVDYGAEIHRSWRRVLRPLRMPDGVESSEARIVLAGDGGPLGLAETGLLAELRAALRAFDWHSQVTIRFAAGEGGAWWSRSERTVTVRAGYLRRFVEQGEALERER